MPRRDHQNKLSEKKQDVKKKRNVVCYCTSKNGEKERMNIYTFFFLIEG